jgi:arginyl-tRNA synthetase
VTTLDATCADASRLRAAFVGTSGYAVAYGSHASRSAPSDSDLDLLFIGPPLRADQLDQLVRAVVALHHDHQLRLDTEVAYEVKLYATAAEVDAALALRGFTISPTGELHVPPVVVAPGFLNSTPFKLRLILNALTTPHVFLGGDIDQYQRQCTKADRAVALVALSLLDGAVGFTVADAVAALVRGPNGATGEDFLGYSHGPSLHATVQRGLAWLIAEQAVRAIDGARFEQHRDTRRRLIAALSGP